MRIAFLIIFAIFIRTTLFAQITYDSPLGFTVTFDKTWKRLPKEVLQQKMKDVRDLLEYQKDIHFDACFQKIGNGDMAYPYMLFKNIYSVKTSDNEKIKKVQEYFSNKLVLENSIQNLVKGKFDFELKVGKIYKDEQSKILIYTYDLGVSIIGDLVGMFAFYFGEKASLIAYCYSYKDEFKYDQKEFLEIIYSIKDKGMISEMPDYLTKHDISVRYFNDGKVSSDKGNHQQAIEFYTKAIENYPPEDNYMKSEAFYNRGLNKRYINDLKEAILDYTEAIKLRPNYYKAYNNRGYAKLLLEDYAGSISDFTMVIKYDNFNTEFTNMALGNRGVAKLSINQDGCADLKKAIELGNKNVIQVYNELCK